MLTMGSDFNYEGANTWFKNLDKLIHYVNMDVGNAPDTMSIKPIAHIGSIQCFLLDTHDLHKRQTQCKYHVDNKGLFWFMSASYPMLKQP